jgi:uncharacterized protein
MTIWGVCLFICLTVLAFAATAAPQFPALTGRVVDEAGLLSPGANSQIADWLAQFEAATKRQVVVVTVKSLQGLPIEDYGYQLGRFWGIGEKGKNTGALLLVAPTEHKVRIEVGYGLEGELTDAISSTIVDQDILPSFKQGNYEAGIVAGTAAILRTLGWNGASEAIPPPPPQRSQKSAVLAGFASVIPFILFFIMFFVFVWRAARHRNQPGGVGMFVLGSLIGSMSGGGGGSSFGGGGFSGGGGSFGGGGASGSW